MTPRQLGLRSGDIVNLRYRVQALFFYFLLNLHIDPFYIPVLRRWRKHYTERYIFPRPLCLYRCALTDLIQSTTFKRSRHST